MRSPWPTTAPPAFTPPIVFRPELILLDLGLPGMDGYEVIRRLRDDESTRNARVIAMTGYGQEEDRHCPLDAGFDDYLTKPVDQNALIAVLRGSSRSVDQLLVARRP